MKNILVFAALLFAYNTSGQITLTQSSYPASVIGTDSLKKTTYNSTFPSLAPAAGGSWDMSTVTDTTPVFFAYRVPAAPYQFADSNTYSLSTYSYKGNVRSDITTGGILQYGVYIESVAYSLTPLTLGATDSLVIGSQYDVYSSPRTVIAFPAALSGVWTSVYQQLFNFQITILPLYNHAPGFVRRYTLEKDTVVGYGKMRVKNFAGAPSGYEDVLQVQTTVITTDSFFVNGTPAMGALLTALSLTQGQKDTVYEQNYYRTGEVTPLARVTFKDAAFTQPEKATVHAQRLPAASVSQIDLEQYINVYPNPTTGSEISVTLPTITGLWSYEIFDATGRSVMNGHLKNSLTQNIILPSGTASGLYYLKVSCNGQQIGTKPFTVAW